MISSICHKFETLEDLVKARIAAVVVGLGLVAGAAPSAVAAPTAARAASCTINNFAPRTVVVGASPVTTRFSIATSGCTLTDWTLDNSGKGSFFVYKDSPQETFDPGFLFNSDAGTSSVVATAENADYAETQKTFAYGFDLQRRVAVLNGKVDASPEPVRKGGTVRIKARLVVVDWDQYPAAKYVSFGGHYVAVQFRTTTGAYKTVKSVKTDSLGQINTTATQSVSGAWRVLYGGTTVFSTATAPGDSVAVS